MNDNRDLFENKPVAKALLSLAVPTIISQLVVMIYNMADTFFIGRTNDPFKVAAASMAYVLFFMLNALANLFGIGGGSLISRMLGDGRREEAKGACAFSVWGAVAVTALYSIVCLVFSRPLLMLIGASENTVGYAASYIFWVVTVGGIPAALSITLSHVLRSEGHGKSAGFGLTMGGILNIFLDPLFMFVLLPEGKEVTGAAVATCISNTVSLIYYIIVIEKLGKDSVLSLDVKKVRDGLKNAGEILFVGVPSAIGTVFVCVSIMVLNSLAAVYSDIPVAAIGIVKKLEMLPHNVGTGLCQGMIPLVAYNFASKNHERMKKAINLTRLWAIGFAALCLVLFVCLARPISSLFIKEPETLGMTAEFLKIMVLAVPLSVCNFQITYTLQAMGRGKESMILSCCRQGIVLIPLFFILNAIFGLYGLIWAQLAADGITLVVSVILYRKTVKKIIL